MNRGDPYNHSQYFGYNNNNNNSARNEEEGAAGTKSRYFQYFLNAIAAISILVVIMFGLRLIIYGLVIAPNAKNGIITFSDDRLIILNNCSGILNGNETVKPQFPNIDSTYYDSKKLDGYHELTNACTDFYEKACSLFDDPLPSNIGSPSNEDESEFSTGTFKDMIDVNSGVVYSIISGYSSYHQCQEFYTGKNATVLLSEILSFYKKFVTDNQITSLYDVWLHGGTSLFKITPRSKVINKPVYSVDFDIDFDLFFTIFKKMDNENVLTLLMKDKSVSSMLKFSNIVYMLKYYYSLFQEKDYPTSIEDYVKHSKFYYKTVKDIPIKYKNIRKVLKTKLGLIPNDIVMMNGQYEFFEASFQGTTFTTDIKFTTAEEEEDTNNNKEKEEEEEEDGIENDFLVFLMAFRSISILFNDKDFNAYTYSHDDSFKDSVSGLMNKINAKLLKRNEMWIKMRKFEKVSKLSTSNFTITADKYCSKIIRKIHFNSINQQYYLLSNSKQHARKIYKLVNSVLTMSEFFFANSTSKKPYATDEMTLHVSNEMAKFSFAKMQHVKIISMSSTNDTFIASLANDENQFLNEVQPSSSWLNLLHRGLLYRHLNTVINVTRETRSENYLKTREKFEEHYEYTWKTVKAETVNAWYDPTINFITIPIGITRYPMFRSDKYYDLGYLGSVIGHELGHATDASGKFFDSYGSWNESAPNPDPSSPPGPKTMTERIECLINDYGKACENENYGHHTLGENMADQFGLRIVLSLVNDYMYKDNGGENLTYTKEFLLQKKVLHRNLFVNFAGVWCGRSTYQEECFNANNDVHALARHRVIKTLRQFPSFKEAFGCKDTDLMVNNRTCMIY